MICCLYYSNTELSGTSVAIIFSLVIGFLISLSIGDSCKCFYQDTNPPINLLIIILLTSLIAMPILCTMFVFYSLIKKEDKVENVDTIV